MRTPISAPITLLSFTLLGLSSGCDQTELDPIEYESEGLEDVLDELPDDVPERALQDEDDDPIDFDPEDVELLPEPDPQEVFAGWVGGGGGSQYMASCPIGDTAIGITAASSGQHVRQLGLVCGPEALVEAGFGVGIGAQWVMSTGYRYNTFFFNAQVAPAEQPRGTFDASELNPSPWHRYKAPGSSYFICDPGYRLNKIDVRSGALVDRIQSITCWWDGPGGQGPRGVVYSRAVNVGGFGGSFGSSSCQTTSENFVDGFLFRSGWILDGFRLDCEE